jgi:hypothetical protein
MTKPEVKKSHEQLIVEDMLARGKAKADTMDINIVPDAAPIESFDTSDDDDCLWAEAENNTHGYRRVYPWRTCGMFQKMAPDTEDDKKAYIAAHKLVKCILRSTVVLDEIGKVDDLNFFCNGTKYDPITFWNIPSNVPVEVPAWVVKHVNKSCKRFEIEYQPLSETGVAQHMQKNAMSLGHEIVKKFKRSTFRFERA